MATGERYANQLAVLSLKSGQWRTLGAGTQPSLSPTGHIVFARDETLWAAPFDSERLEILGTPMPILRDVMVNRGHGTAHYTMARDGTLIYLTASAAASGQVRRIVPTQRARPGKPAAAATPPYVSTRPDGI